MIPVINTNVMINCATTNDLRRKTPLLLVLKDPFKTLTGLKPEMISAGYKPDNMPSKIVTTTRKIINPGDENNEISFPVIWENTGFTNAEKRRAVTKAIVATSTASDKYWKINWPLTAPTTFFIPTSFARSTDLAVARFI